MNKHLFEKIASCVCDHNMQVLVGSRGFSASNCAQKLVDLVGLEMLVTNLTNIDAYDRIDQAATVALLCSDQHADDFVDLTIFNKSYLKHYNSAVRFVAGQPSSSLIFDADQSRLTNSLTRLLKIDQSKISELILPLCESNSEIFLEAMLNAGYELDSILKSAEIISLIALSKPLKNHGVFVFKNEDLNRPRRHPLEPFQSFSADQLTPLFNLLRNIHGPLAAQMKIDDQMVSFSKAFMHSFLDKTDVDIYVKNNISSFVGKAIKYPPLYGEALRIVIRTYKSNGLTHELDQCNPRLIKKLVEKEFIDMDDVKQMPNALKFMKKEVLHHDLEI